MRLLSSISFHKPFSLLKAMRIAARSRLMETHLLSQLIKRLFGDLSSIQEVLLAATEWWFITFQKMILWLSSMRIHGAVGISLEFVSKISSSNIHQKINWRRYMINFMIAIPNGPPIVSWQIIQTKKLEVKPTNSTEH